MLIRKLKRIALLIGITWGLLSACTLSQTTEMPTLKPGAVYTLAAQTVSAQLTLSSDGTPQPDQDSDLSPNQTLTPSGTSSSAKNPDEAPATPVSEELYDHMTFIEDVTYPDGADVAPGAIFTKTWRVKNTGTHTWTPGYSLVFDHGDAMGTTSSFQFTTEDVEPGEIIDVSVDLTAPEEVGTYQGYWMLRNLEGELFGTGDLSQPFWVKVDVVAGLGVAFDFNAYADEAVWATGTIPVDGNGPGQDALSFGPPDETGQAFANLENDLDLENGRRSDWVLHTYPPPGINKYIIGKYPPYTINAGEHITGKVGLLANPDGSCGDGDVKFQIKYANTEQPSSMKTLWEHNKTCDGMLHEFEIDLSALVGGEIQFYLAVVANTSAEENHAVWDSLAVKR